MAKVSKVVFGRDPKGEWRYRKIARNGRDVGGSEEGFVHRGYMLQRALGEVPAGTPFFEETGDGRLVPVDVTPV